MVMQRYKTSMLKVINDLVSNNDVSVDFIYYYMSL